MATAAAAAAAAVVVHCLSTTVYISNKKEMKEKIEKMPRNEPKSCCQCRHKKRNYFAGFVEYILVCWLYTRDMQLRHAYNAYARSPELGYLKYVELFT